MSNFLLAVAIIGLILAFTIYLIKLGAAGDNERARIVALNALKWITISLAIAGSLYTIFGWLIAILR